MLLLRIWGWNRGPGRRRLRLGRRIGRLRGPASRLREHHGDHSHAHPQHDDRRSATFHNLLHSSLTANRRDAGYSP